MDKDLVSKKQYFSLATLIILGEGLTIGGYTMPENGAWLAFLIAVMYAFILAFFYGYILRKFPNMDIHDIFLKVFGKIFGRILIILFVSFILFSSIIYIRTIVSIISGITFVETPEIILGIALVLFSYLLIKNGIEVFSRIMTVILQLLLILLVLFVVELTPEMEFINLLPIVAVSVKEIVKGSLFNFFMITGDVVLLMGIMVNMKNDKNVHYKAFSKAIAISGVVSVIIILSNIATLGLPFVHIVHSQTYLSFSIINIGNFLTRIEVALSTFLITAYISKFAIALFVGARGLQKLLNKKNTKPFVIPFGILILFFALEVDFFNNFYQIRFVKEEYGWIKGIFQIVIPIILAIIVTFIKEKQKPKTSIFNFFKKS